MPPRRRAAAVGRTNTRALRTSKRAGRSTTGQDNGVPQEFRDLLAEAEEEEKSRASANESGGSVIVTARPLKRRRVGEGPSLDEALRPEIVSSDGSDREAYANAWNGSSRLQTIAIDDFSSEDEASDFEWEDVGLAGKGAAEPAQDDGDDTQRNGVTIMLNEHTGSRERGGTATRRRAITAAERSMRLDVHKIHICCLIHHSFLRNSFCNDAAAQAILRAQLLDDRALRMLQPNTTYPQMRRNALFLDGLKHVQAVWQARYRLTRLGLRRAHWAASADEVKQYTLPDAVEVALTRDDLRAAAGSLEGSADLGAQLLCALLRSAGVTTRLVCSLQPLPYSAAGPQVQTPQKQEPQKTVVYATVPGRSADDWDSAADEGDSSAWESPAAAAASDSPVMPRRIARAGRSRVTSNGTTAATTNAIDLGKAPTLIAPQHHPQHRRVPQPSYPVYWVEAYNEAQQKWTALDALATQTLGRPSRLEPPASDPAVGMSYVVAFEADGSARDVTRRYARAFNAKTRRLRVEGAEGEEDGGRWLSRALAPFQRPRGAPPLDRDALEDAELARREAAEGMPRSVQDFKGHPVYVLERHLRHDEALASPRHEVGKVVIGGAEKGKLEPVYRRRDVRVVWTADKWYRHGREVRAGEQPLKHGRRRNRRRRAFVNDEDMAAAEEQAGQEAEAGAALYARSQTDPYIAPPVVRGRVPRNAFGNIDVYTPSMVPAGGVHIPHAETSKAARLLGIDSADAVTGFRFQGGRGRRGGGPATAVVQGAVVAVEHADAVRTVIAGFERERAEALEARRAAGALRLWRRFMAGLKVVERMQEYRGAAAATEGQEDDEEATAEDEEEGEGGVQRELDRLEREDDADDAGGGFLPDAASPPSRPRRAAAADDSFAGGFMADEDPDPQTAAYDEERHSPRSPSSRTRPPPPLLTRNSSYILPDGASLVGFEDIALDDYMVSPENEATPRKVLIPLHEPAGQQRRRQRRGGSPSSSSSSSVRDDDNAGEEEYVSDDGVVMHSGVAAAARVPLSARLNPGPEDQIPGAMDTAAAAEPDGGADTSPIPLLPPNEQDHSERGDDVYMQEDEEVDEDDERGSLLSHDPEDEDGEPDWLEVVSD